MELYSTGAEDYFPKICTLWIPFSPIFSRRPSHIVCHDLTRWNFLHQLEIFSYISAQSLGGFSNDYRHSFISITSKKIPDIDWEYQQISNVFILQIFLNLGMSVITAK